MNETAEKTTDTGRSFSDSFGDFLISRGGPFYELQERLGLLREKALRAPRRAAIFVAVAWGGPLLLTLFAGTAYGPWDSHPYLLSPDAWARFVIAIGLFLLMDRTVEERLRTQLGQFAAAPLLAPSAVPKASLVRPPASTRRATLNRETHRSGSVSEPSRMLRPKITWWPDPRPLAPPLVS